MPKMAQHKKRYPVQDNMTCAGTIFITGISASGKSTLGKCLEENLTGIGIRNIRVIDGEAIRKELVDQGEYYGYSQEERRKVSLHMAHMASAYNQEGVICIICSICHTRELRAQMRAIIGNVMEVYLDCPVSICAQRDYKGQYSKALKGACDNFIGITEPYQQSDHVELVLHTGSKSIEECSEQLFNSAIVFLSGQHKANNCLEDVVEMDNKPV